MAIPMLWDPELTAQEIHRVAEKGCHSLTFTENPAALGLPSFHNEHWDPMFRALVETESILNIHLGSSGQLSITAPDAPIDVMITLQPMNICQAAADLLWSRVIKEHPDLRIALSEGGTGWIPYFMDRLDRTYDMHHAWTGQHFDELPSEVFKKHFLTCFIADPIGLKLREDIGVDNICWEMDYPHSDSSWPNAPEEFHGMCEKFGVSDAEMNKISHENAMSWYHFDPYAIRAKEQCTVGALRGGGRGPRRVDALVRHRPLREERSRPHGPPGARHRVEGAALKLSPRSSPRARHRSRRRRSACAPVPPGTAPW